MRYEKPLRSAGLVTAGLICLVVGALAFVLGGGGKEQDSVLFAALAALAGLALGITGVWRFLSALDGLALRTLHAPDERIPLAVLDRGVATMIRAVRALVLPDSAAP